MKTMDFSELAHATIATMSRIFGIAPLAILLELAPQTLRTAERLDVELRSFPGDRQALETMFSGGCALSTVAAPPVWLPLDELPEKTK